MGIGKISMDAVLRKDKVTPSNKKAVMFRKCGFNRTLKNVFKERI